MNQSPQQAAAPLAGSHAYFAWLYTPASRRDDFRTLLALADEIGAHRAASTDHNVAHIRLEWWRQETLRFARAQPQHPWLKSMLSAHPDTARLNLQSLVEAAAVDLAAQTLRDEPGIELQRALFATLADALTGESLPPQQREAAAALGASAQRLGQPEARQDALTQASHSVAIIGTARQARLTPLLVWMALAARGSRPTSRFSTLGDNFTAWKAARRAAQGQFTLI